MEPEQDIVAKKDGKMMVLRRGEWHNMDMVMTLSNGTRVAMDGTMSMPDGTTRMMMDGEALTLDGEPTTLADTLNPDHTRDDGIENS